MKYVLPLCLLLLLTFTTFFVSAKSDTSLNLDESGLAIQGYDPVSYHMDKPRKGSKEFTVDYQGATYRFADHTNLEAFQQDPDKYVPAFGGWCAWAMLDGEKVRIDPETYKIVNGQTYLYYNFFFVNTLKKWNELADEQTEEALVVKAEKQWQKLNQSSAEAK